MERKTPLGKLEQVPLREYWQKEDTEFTPWLGQPENLKLLGDAIGKDLEPQGQEVGVGPFRADILCRETATNDLVLIENQIEQTDHSHLGQILTYVAGLEAKTVVWIARQFRDEHRAALDWLNEVTRDDIEFYGLQVELWRIGDSPPAPRFDVVAHPNEWTREVRETARPTGPLTASQEKLVAFWRALADHLEHTGSSRRRPRVAPEGFQNWSLGRSEIEMCVRLSPRDGRADVFVVFMGSEAKPRFRALVADRTEIERDLGCAPVWDEKPDRKESHIRVEQTCDFERPETWEPVHRWVVETLDRFDRVFRARVKALE